MSHAKILLGCYRMGDASDPEIYTAAVIAVLSNYPVDTISYVCNPVTGLPGSLKWLPTVAEIKEACETHHGRFLRLLEIERREREQLAERDKISIKDHRQSPSRDRISYKQFLERAKQGFSGRAIGFFENDCGN